MASAQQSAQQQIAANGQLRAILLASAPRMRKNLGSFTVNALGGTTRVKIFNVGILTSLQIAVTCPVTIAGAPAVPSPKAPYNIIGNVTVIDYDGTNRVNMSGLQLFVLNCVRQGMAYGYNNDGPIVTATGSSILGGIITNPNIPTAVGNGTIQFLLDIPLAYDPESDLRGSILAQTAVGEMYLNITWNNTLYGLNNVEAVYGGVGSGVVLQAGVTGPTVQVWQEYLLPQSVGGGLPIPAIDLQTVYELNGMLKTSDNLAVGQEKLINYPNVRSVIGGYFNYVDGNAMLANDLTQFRLIANGNNVLRDDTLYSQQVRQRNLLDADIGPGIYWFLHRNKPIETALFGNVQAGITPSVVAAGSYVEVMFESFYTKGSALPGMNQG